MDADRTVQKQESIDAENAARGKIIAAMWKKEIEERKAKGQWGGIDWDFAFGRKKPTNIPHPLARRG